MDDIKIGIIGLGYIGLPLALSFGRIFDVVGFDRAVERVNQLQKSYDKNEELSAHAFKAANLVKFTSNVNDIADCNCYIVTVETPIDENYKPDISSLRSVCELLGKYLEVNNYVIFESTVYPGCTENDCVPILEKVSKLKYNSDFFCGYSPERISPGKGSVPVEDIVKITSGSCKQASKFVKDLYSQIITAGVHEAASIKVAEAAKVTENIQRDVNIALVNELAMFYGNLDIDIYEVLDAAATKWNFHKYLPGLVGGHCIGVDPYYLINSAHAVSENIPIVELARETNERTVDYLVERSLSILQFRDKNLQKTSVLFLGKTFKANCNDTRNSKVPEFMQKLSEYCYDIQCYDPLLEEIDNQNNLVKMPITKIKNQTYDMIILAVAHDEFLEKELQEALRQHPIVFDVTGQFRHLNNTKSF